MKDNSRLFFVLLGALVLVIAATLVLQNKKTANLISSGLAKFKETVAPPKIKLTSELKKTSLPALQIKNEADFMKQIESYGLFNKNAVYLPNSLTPVTAQRINIFLTNEEYPFYRIWSVDKIASSANVKFENGSLTLSLGISPEVIASYPSDRKIISKLYTAKLFEALIWLTTPPADLSNVSAAREKMWQKMKTADGLFL